MNVMERQNDQNLIYSGKILPRALTPYLIIIIGLPVSIISWYIISTTTWASLNIPLPRILLISGILLTFVTSALLYLRLLFKKQSQSLKQMNNHFQQEIKAHLLALETKKKLEIGLLQGQKLQAIGTLAGGIAHDFNNILYAIKGYVEMSRDDIDQNLIAHKNLGKVLEATQRGQDLVARILAFGRKNQQIELSAIEARALLDTILSLLKPTIPASVSININSPEEKIYILGNQTQLHQAVINLINNAVDAMEGEGLITINIQRIIIDDPIIIESRQMVNCNYCQIDIIDSGFGMEQHIADRIFEPFFTTKEVGKGTGLGLSTVHAIMEQHLGEVTVKSQLGEGSTFSLIFPEHQIATINTENHHGDYSFSRR